MPSMLDAALDYCKRGWSVIPIRFEGSVEDQKRPLLTSWEPYQKQAANETQVRAWWTQWPKANIGLVMGAVSGLIALDLDGANATDLLRQAHIYLPQTAAVQTARGYHAIYRHPGYRVNNQVKLLSGGGSGIDIRGDGGYIVAPPSVHGSGAVYTWVVQPDQLVPLPESVAALLSRHIKREEGEVDATWFAAAWKGAPDGQRNDTAAKLAGYWLHVTKGNIEATYRAMEDWARRCQPPMDLSELRTTIKSVARLEAAKQSYEQTKGFNRHAVIEGPQWADELKSQAPREGVNVQVPGMQKINGLVPGDLIVLAGRPGAGKSTMACQLTVEACFREGLPTLVISSEMTRHQWGTWMAAYVNGSGTASLPKPLSDAILQWWKFSSIAITDSGAISIQDIRRIAEGRLGLKLLIVDHITRITGGRKESRVLEVGDVARGLKAIAKDLHCTVLALAHLNRRVESDDHRRPRLSDLRECGEIEQEADAVMFLWTKDPERNKAHLPMILSVEKHRHGGTGDIDLMFEKVQRRFAYRVATQSEYSEI